MSCNSTLAATSEIILHFQPISKSAIPQEENKLSENNTKNRLKSSLGIGVKKAMREGVFIILMAVSIYLLLSLVTFNINDPGWNHSSGSSKVLNSGGYFGAMLANIFLLLFGYISYLFPLIVGYSGILVYRWRNPEQTINWGVLGLRWIGFLLTLVAGAGIAALHHKVGNGVLPMDDAGCKLGNTGGVIGCLVSVNLSEIIGYLGATLLLLAFFLGGTSLFIGISWLSFADFIGHLVITITTLLFKIIRAVGRKIGALFISKNKPKEKDKNPAIEKQENKKVKKEKKKKAPEIKSDLPQIEASDRSHKERQTSLFDLPSGDNLPPFSLLDGAPEQDKGYSDESLEAMSRLVEMKLAEFRVEVEVVAVHPGPVVTRYELKPAVGVKVNQITNLAKDLARALSAISVRVVDVIPGKDTVGLEIPNEIRQLIALSEITESKAYDKSSSNLTIALGKDISGHPVVADIAKMPHLLVAGTTGSGKSVGVNAMIVSLLYKSTPEQVRMIMIDPKMLELSVYDGIPHLLTPVVTDMKEAAHSLRWSVAEMERRYQLMAALGVRNISGFNKKVKDAEKNGNPIADPLYKAPVQIVNEDGSIDMEQRYLETLPFIVVIIDEFADMMMIVGKKVEELIARLAQKARAAGIHLILATQRPSVDVITGLIKANIPTRIAFQVSSKIDSRTILDQMGAEQLLGHGDMLFLPPGSGVPERVHGAFVSDQEVHRVVSYLKENCDPPEYVQGITEEPPADAPPLPGIDSENSDDTESDPLYDQAVSIVLETRKASASGIQRRLKIGYNRAARLIEQMEAVGIVGPLESNGSREVIAPPPPDMD